MFCSISMLFFILDRKCIFLVDFCQVFGINTSEITNTGVKQMTNKRQNNPRYEVFLALSRLTDADYHIDRSDNAIIGFEYRAARCYKLSCGYRITNIGIFDSKSHKINISRAYEKKLYEIAEKKFNSVKKISY